MESESEVSSKGLLIQGSDFALKALDEASYQFDLYLLKVVNKGKENQKYEFKVYGYGMCLGYAINAIIQYRVRKRHSKFVDKGDKALVHYYKIWAEEKIKLLKLFDLSNEDWKKLTRVKQAILEVHEDLEAQRAAERLAAKQAKKKSKKGEPLEDNDEDNED